jgi:DNA modification methylase
MTDLRLGDCLDVMRDLADASVDAVVTDPPYGIGFMGKDWDSPGGTGDFPMRRSDPINTVNTGVTRQGGRQRSCEDFTKRQARDARDYQARTEAWATEALRVLKPGGHALVFGGTRTYHRLASGLEDAGFEIRDCLAWLYGSGFPKSLNLPGGLGTALKPAFEPVVVARKSLIGTVAANVLEHGTGALNIDACRIEGAKGDGNWKGKGAIDPGFQGGWASVETDENASGRWPANVVLDDEAAALLDAQTGELPSPQPYYRTQDTNPGVTGWNQERAGDFVPMYGDTGGASRFFYCAKVSRAERNAGLEGFEEQEREGQSAWAGLCNVCGSRMMLNGKPTCGHDDFEWVTGKPTKNVHPTVKPIDLMRWLIRLVTPPGGLILDPFLGSGSTGCAAALEGFRFVGIEREADYMAIAEARIAHWTEQARIAASQLSLLADGTAA